MTWQYSQRESHKFNIWVISFHLCVAWEREYFSLSICVLYLPVFALAVWFHEQYEFPLAEFKQSCPLSVPYCSVHANFCGHVESWVGELVVLKWNLLFPCSFSTRTKRKKGNVHYQLGEYPCRVCCGSLWMACADSRKGHVETSSGEGWDSFQQQCQLILA